ncbi:hypothetical protein C8R43DRAFT_1111162 [Mycena crocata]|nr:hypothetical protein C8R43DRAFT_1111162 [Mycena crocata]
MSVEVERTGGSERAAEGVGEDERERGVLAPAEKDGARRRLGNAVIVKGVSVRPRARAEGGGVFWLWLCCGWGSNGNAEVLATGADSTASSAAKGLKRREGRVPASREGRRRRGFAGVTVYGVDGVHVYAAEGRERSSESPEGNLEFHVAVLARSGLGEWTNVVEVGAGATTQVAVIDIVQEDSEARTKERKLRGEDDPDPPHPTMNPAIAIAISSARYAGSNWAPNHRQARQSLPNGKPDAACTSRPDPLHSGFRPRSSVQVSGSRVTRFRTTKILRTAVGKSLEGPDPFRLLSWWPTNLAGIEIEICSEADCFLGCIVFWAGFDVILMLIIQVVQHANNISKFWLEDIDARSRLVLYRCKTCTVRFLVARSLADAGINSAVVHQPFDISIVILCGLFGVKCQKSDESRLLTGLHIVLLTGLQSSETKSQRTGNHSTQDKTRQPTQTPSLLIHSGKRRLDNLLRTPYTLLSSLHSHPKTLSIHIYIPLLLTGGIPAEERRFVGRATTRRRFSPPPPGRCLSGSSGVIFFFGRGPTPLASGVQRFGYIQRCGAVQYTLQTTCYFVKRYEQGISMRSPSVAARLYPLTTASTGIKRRAEVRILLGTFSRRASRIHTFNYPG